LGEACAPMIRSIENWDLYTFILGMIFYYQRSAEANPRDVAVLATASPVLI